MLYIPAELDGRNRSIKVDALLWPRTAPTEAGGRGPTKHLPNQAREVKVTLGSDCLSAWRGVSRLSPTRPEDPHLPGRITSPNAMSLPEPSVWSCRPAVRDEAHEAQNTHASTPCSPSDRITTHFHSPGRPPFTGFKGGGPVVLSRGRCGGREGDTAQPRVGVDGVRAPGAENYILPSPSLGLTLG